jgi:hypothetical protein
MLDFFERTLNNFSRYAQSKPTSRRGFLKVVAATPIAVKVGQELITPPTAKAYPATPDAPIGEPEIPLEIGLVLFNPRLVGWRNSRPIEDVKDEVSLRYRSERSYTVLPNAKSSTERLKLRFTPEADREDNIVDKYFWLNANHNVESRVEMVITSKRGVERWAVVYPVTGKLLTGEDEVSFIPTFAAVEVGGGKFMKPVPLGPNSSTSFEDFEFKRGDPFEQNDPYLPPPNFPLI